MTLENKVKSFQLRLVSSVEFQVGLEFDNNKLGPGTELCKAQNY